MLWNNQYSRLAIYQFSFWLIRVINRVDREIPEMFYFLPEKFVRMPFETVRAMKRARVTLYENDLKDG